MTDQSKRPRQSLKVPSRARDYAVGYGKPPIATRFQPGQSGNPRGRLKGSARKNNSSLDDERLKNIILEEAYRTIRIDQPNGQVDIPMAQAIVRSLAVSAAKGDPRAQRLFTQLLSGVEKDQKQLNDEWLKTAIEYKTFWEHELYRRKRLGIQAPPPIPHPDDIIIDMQTGTVHVTGPMTPEEKVERDQAFDQRSAVLEQVAKPEARERIAKLEVRLKSEPNPSKRKKIEADIRTIERSIEAFDQVISEWSIFKASRG